jgi:hypothetical protein
MIQAIVRYVEAKCLVARLTTSIGMSLMAAPRISYSYRGIVRNVEQTDAPALPEAQSHRDPRLQIIGATVGIRDACGARARATD